MDLEYENGKQLEVTIIKITESKENKSIHRLNVSGWGLAQQVQGGGSCRPCPPPPPASHGSALPQVFNKGQVIYYMVCILRKW